MKCKIDGCDRDAQYQAAQLCQMHYFRIRRNGTVEKVTERKKRLTGHSRQPRVVMPGKGYIRLYEPGHPLVDTQGYVAEHRKVVFAKYGWSLPPCDICGKPTDWATCHIDHIDCVVSNNSVENLRPVCRPCNTFRHYPEQHTMKRRIAITYNGITKTAHEWVRELGIDIASNTVRTRLKKGMTVENALYGNKITHNGKKKKTPTRIVKRSAITIDGVTMTANEWARHPDCTVTNAAILTRIKKGWSDYDSVFAKRTDRVQKAKELQRG